MEPVRQSRRIQEKVTKDPPTPKNKKNSSQPRTNRSPSPTPVRSKSNKSKNKTPPKSKSRGKSPASRSPTPTRALAGTGNNKSNPPTKTPRRSRSGAPKDSLLIAREHLQSHKRQSRSKRKAPDAGEIKMKRTSNSAKKTKKTSQSSQDRRKNLKPSKSEEVEEVEDSQSESGQIEIEKKTNKKKVENIRKNVVVESTKEKDQKKQVKVMEVLVSCKGNNYNIWRKILISDEMPFTRLARIIVTAMGWLGYRYWQFLINDVVIMLPPDDDADRQPTTGRKKYADQVNLEDFKLEKDTKFQFHYGEDDNVWVHEILIENGTMMDRNSKGTSDKNKATNHAILVTGMFSVPRDDSNPKEIEKIMEAYHKGPAHFSQYKENYNPEEFEKESINETLKIHLYDKAKMPKELLEDDIYFRF